ncbi:hypothetical protein F2Q69_00061486 [Brassica cretica]|uniref:Reverse transcriptase zinc-binding domain-containing protein n=1 Tax=Brassica cretica TaxID=69181 RepID=A0A8S9RCX9_BRACR|nr:hypothetical protein F2Q69_00061486 [Brassica cretica]
MQKTSFYASGLTPSETDLIQASTGMALGSLPFRYLGVPLNSRKLSLTNCEPLIHQIKTWFSSWSVKSLSFSGRLLLIKTVIAGVTTFWCSAYTTEEQASKLQGHKPDSVFDHDAKLVSIWLITVSLRSNSLRSRLLRYN